LLYSKIFQRRHPRKSGALGAKISCAESIIIDTENLRFWLALLRASGIGAATYNSLLKAVGPPLSIFHESKKALSALALSDASIQSLQHPDWSRVDLDLQWASEPNHHILTLSHKNYPPLLKEISVPPPVLFVIGESSLLSWPQIAIVGSRNPSTLGEKTAHSFAASLAKAGLCITSGMALGIDAASHQASLANRGKTIAVTGTGLDRVYPARHKQLAHNISRNGAIISEFVLGSAPKANHFPRRNRIISGLSLGTLVVEAAKRSGSLITARHALEEGREVFAIPGSIHNPLARGCNELIRQGAKLVETAEDILEELNLFVAEVEQDSTMPTDASALERTHQNILKFVAYSPTSIDTLVEETGESAEVIASTLLLLELQGYVESAAGGHYYRIK